MVYMDNGLSADDALAALTTTPASILGISSMTGTVEKGKMANLMVSTAPYFTKDSQIKMMFVDGERFDYAVKEKKGKKDKEAKAEEAAKQKQMQVALPANGTTRWTAHKDLQKV